MREPENMFHEGDVLRSVLGERICKVSIIGGDQHYFIEPICKPGQTMADVLKDWQAHGGYSSRWVSYAKAHEEWTLHERPG